MFTPYVDWPKEKLFGHHGSRYYDNLITLYDENYNRRKRPMSQSLPPIRSWDRKYLCWFPEKSDFPMQGMLRLSSNSGQWPVTASHHYKPWYHTGRSTNWGLKEATFSRHALEAQESCHTSYHTTYNREYPVKPASSPAQRLVVPMIYQG